MCSRNMIRHMNTVALVYRHKTVSRGPKRVKTDGKDISLVQNVCQEHGPKLSMDKDTS